MVEATVILTLRRPASQDSREESTGRQKAIWTNFGVRSSSSFATGVKKYLLLFDLPIQSDLPTCFDAQGKAERDACYEPMKEALLAHFAHVSDEERYHQLFLAPY